ncbi:MAG: hypothetical protein WAL91_09190 [Propionicimonas sp.]
MDVLHVDCATCRARGPACADCVISVLLGPMSDEVILDGPEQAALAAMAGSGLLPPLRLLRSVPPPDPGGVAIRAALP